MAVTCTNNVKRNFGHLGRANVSLFCVIVFQIQRELKKWGEQESEINAPIRDTLDLECCGQVESRLNWSSKCPLSFYTACRYGLVIGVGFLFESIR